MSMQEYITILLNILQLYDGISDRKSLITVKAGFPSPAETFIKKSIDLNSAIIRNTSATFFMKVEGESMVKAGIFNGDIVVIDRSLEPKNGDVVIVEYNGELLIKRLVLSGKEIILAPENDDFQKIKIHTHDNFAVWGVVTFVIKRLR